MRQRKFIITDQQGNARISFKNNGSNAAVVTQENSYYGYGMAFLTSTVPIPTVPNKQLYNGGSEWQNDYSNLPDYYQTFYRNYDAVLGRFVGVDPEPESAESLTTYNYAGGNPIMYNDPMGNYMFDPSKPGFNEQVGNMWTDPGMLSSLAGGGGVGGSIGSGGGGASGNGTDSNNEGGSNASFYPLYDAALTGDARAIEQYAAANAAYLPDGTIASYEVVRAQNYGVGVTGGPVYWQGTDSYNTKKSSASQGGITASQYLASWGAEAAALENFAGKTQLGNWKLYFENPATGRVFTGNQWVKTLGLAKTGKVLGVAGGIAGMTLDGVGVYNYYHPTFANKDSRVSPGKFGADGVMTAVGIWGGPIGAGASVLYFGIDAFYPGGVQGASNDYINTRLKYDGSSAGMDATMMGLQ